MDDLNQEDDNMPEHVEFDVLGEFHQRMEAASAEDEVDSSEEEEGEGPGEPGELDPQDPSTEENPGEPEADPEQGDEDEPDEEPEPEGEPESQTSELDLIKAELAATRQQQQQLFQNMMLLMQQKAQPQAPAQDASLLPDEVVEAALYGGEQSQQVWEGLDPSTRARAKAFASDTMKRQARYAQKPALQYQEQFRALVQQDMQKMLQPLLQSHYDTQAQQIVQRHAADLPDHSTRIAEVYQSLPGSRSSNPAEMEATFKFAADFVRKELAQQGVAAREQKVETSERQKKANRKAARRGRPRGRGKPPSKPVPKLDLNNMSLAKYAERLSEEGF